MEATLQLWSDYYSVKKPYCLTCQQQGIAESEYKFCSLEKKPSIIYDERGRNIKTYKVIKPVLYTIKELK